MRRNMWKWLPVAGGIVLIVGTILVLLTLRFGDPQASKWVYIFQAYVAPGWHDGLIPRPDAYSGVWRDWHANGQVRFEYCVKDGRLDGVWRRWARNGALTGERPMRDGKPHGVMRAWDEHARKTVEQEYLHGLRHGRSTIWDDGGEIIEQGEYRHGEPYTGSFLELRAGLLHTAEYKDGVRIAVDGEPVER